MKPDQERVSALLLDTVTLLCKNGLTFKNKLSVQGVIGITIDDDQVFIVHINEKLLDDSGNNSEAAAVRNDCSKVPLTSSSLQSGPLSVPLFEAVSDQPLQRALSSKQRSWMNLGNCCDSSYRYKGLDVMDSIQKKEFHCTDDVIDVDPDEETKNEGKEIRNIDIAAKGKYSGLDDLADTNQRIDGGTFENFPRKIEQGFDSNETNNYSVFSNEEQYLDNFGNEDGGVNYLQGEMYEESGENLETDIKPDLSSSLPSLTSWKPRHHQRFCLQTTAFGRREAVNSQRTSKKLEYHTQARRQWAVGQGLCYGSKEVADATAVAKLHPSRVHSSVQRMPVQTSSSMPISYFSKTMFFCDLCNRSFTDRSNLLRHQIVKHGRKKMRRGRPSKTDSLPMYQLGAAGN